MFLAENLKYLRNAKNMTQEEVAEKLNVSAQSVSKWERGDTCPDITLLPTLAILYKTSIDALFGMDKINDIQAKSLVYEKSHDYLRVGDYNLAANVISEQLKIFPNDEGLMSELAMALALDGDEKKLIQAISICERLLHVNESVKIHHTTRAALCFMYFKIGDKEKAIETAKNLPHIRESRESILNEFDRDPLMNSIDAYLKFIALGEDDQQEIINIDFGVDLIKTVVDKDLPEIIHKLRINSPTAKIPIIRLRDNTSLLPNQIRVRYYADYLLDKVFNDSSEVIPEVMTIIHKVVNECKKNK